MTESVIDTNKSPEHVTDVVAHESHLKGSEGLFILQTKNNQILPVGDVCASAKENGRFSGNVEEMIEHVVIFFREVVHLLRDGYGVNLAGLIELFLNIGGTIKTPNAPLDPKENPVTLRTRLLHGAAMLVQGIIVRNWGLAPATARIDQITDSKTKTINDVITPNSPFTLEGALIKITGTSTTSDRIGVSFVSTGAPSTEVGVTENLVLNDPTKVIGVTPNLPSGKTWKIKIRTKYSGSGKELKETREIMSTFPVHTV
jgi:hypothetical protein